MAEDIEFRLKVIEDKLSTALTENEKKAKSLGSTLSVALGTFASSVALKGISLLAEGFSDLVDFVGDSVQAASESEVALNRLQLALAQTGLLTDQNVEHFKELADQIQKTTAFEDDAVVSSIALLQTMARLDSEGLSRATQATVDLAAAFNLDLDTATRLVAKSAEGNIAAFKKLGIEFNKGADDAETFANVLTTIESRFGGSAIAQVNTYAGSVKQLENTYDDLKEAIGGVVVANPAVIAAFQTVKTLLSGVGNSIVSAFSGKSNDQVAEFFKLLLDGSQAVVVIADGIGRGFSIAANAVLGAVRIMALGIITPIAGVLELAASIPKIGDAFRSSADFATREMNRLSIAANQNGKAIIGAFTDQTALSGLSREIGRARTNFDNFYEDVSKKGPILKNNLTPEAGKVQDEGQQKRLEQLNRDLLDLDRQYLLSKEQLEFENDLGEQERFLKRSAEQIQRITDFELQKSELLYQAAVANTAALSSEEEKRLAKDKALKDKDLRNLAIQNKGKKDLRAQEIQDQQTFFSTAASLSNSSNKELATIGKLAALTQIAIQTPQAVASSFNFGARIGGPALGFALGAIAATAMAAQAAKVAGVKGFADGGIIGGANLGASDGSDNKVATVREGEMILNATQQKRLFDMISSGSNGGDVVVNIDGREVFRAVRNQLQQGMKFA